MHFMEYDPFQKKAIEAIRNKRSVLVSAPTGSGKTAIAEYAIEQALRNNESVVYTAPIKALSNQKFRDFTTRYPDKVGILTGDVSINPRAPVLIMTTEIYRNQLFEDIDRLKNTSWIIFDEVHYIDDYERGTVWEEAIMFSPKDVRILALSATAPNVEELADWMRSILDHEIEVVLETERPVPLRNYFQCQGQIFQDIGRLKKDGFLNYDSWPNRRARQGPQRGGRRQRFMRHHIPQFLRSKPNRAEDLIRYLQIENRLPCLYFAFGRRRCEELAWAHKIFDFLKPEEKDEITALYDDLCRRFELTAEPSAIKMRPLVERGVTFHHAGMIPTLKEVVERLFTSRLIKLIFTTETFALGINMPARSVVFDELRKFHGSHFGVLKTRDYYQMAGRAGRRGIDTEGFVYARVDPEAINIPTLNRVVFGEPEPIMSQFNSCYATLLNLYGHYGDRLTVIYPKSFHFFQSGKRERQKAEEMLNKKIWLLKNLGYIRNGKLTQKGEFASWMYGYELVLGEMLAAGYLDTLDEAGLSVLLCALVYEPRKNQLSERLSGYLRGIEKECLRFLRIIYAKESNYRIEPETKPPQFHLAKTVEAWVRKTPFNDLGRFTDTDEGELIRYFRMTNQLLRQIIHAPQVSPKLRGTAEKARQLVNRDLVDAEKQLSYS